MNDAQLKVRVTPKASKNEIGDWRNGELQIRLTVVPEKGHANKALIALLAKKLGIGKGEIEIVSGSKSRQKVLKIRSFNQEKIDEFFPK